MFKDPSAIDLVIIGFAFIVAVLSTSRITRLLTYDGMPLFVWFRNKWDKVTGDSEWNLLLHCSYCASVWVAPFVLLSGYWSDLHPVWWAINGSLAMAYLAAWWMSHDGEE